MDISDSVAELRGVLVVAVATAIAALEPIDGKVLTPLTAPLVVILIYTSFNAINSSEVNIREEIRRVMDVSIIVLLISYIALPVVAFILGDILLSSDGELLGVIIICAGPATAGSALVWTRLSNGDVVLTASVILLSLLVSPLITPFLIDGLASTPAGIPVTPIVRTLLLIVLGGYVVNKIVPDDRLTGKTADSVSLLTIGILVYIGVTSTTVSSASSKSILMVASVAVLTSGAVLSLNLILGKLYGLDLRTVKSAFLSSGLKNLGIAIVVVGSLPMFVDTEGTALAVVVFYIVQQLAAALLVAIS